MECIWMVKKSVRMIIARNNVVRLWNQSKIDECSISSTLKNNNETKIHERNSWTAISKRKQQSTWGTLLQGNISYICKLFNKWWNVQRDV